MIEIPSATRPNDKERDKRFLIKDYKFFTECLELLPKKVVDK